METAVDKERFRSVCSRYLTETAPVLIIGFDGEQHVIEANAFAHKILGADIVGKSVDKVFISFSGPIDLAAFCREQNFERLLHVEVAEGPPESFRFRFDRVDERIYALGRPDLPEMQMLRKEMLRLNNELAALTRELQKKNHRLEELDRLKNQFLGMAAHDLRKPVGAVLSYSEFLIDEASDLLSGEHLGFLKTIRESTWSMLRLIDDFLDLAVIESGKLALDLRVGDIRKPLQKSVDLNLLTARKRGVSIDVDIAGEIPKVLMDSAKIEQVFNNLIGNAVEHTESQSAVQIRIASRQDRLCIEVTDEGPGLAAEELDRLFSPYKRGKAKKAAGVRSTGLGLAISKMIVNAHGGDIGAENRAGKGAVFFFFLPLAASSPERIA